VSRQGYASSAMEAFSLLAKIFYEMALKIILNGSPLLRHKEAMNT
jgi:hypothetical protein